MANNKKEKKEKKVYRDGLSNIKNPATTPFGKIMIWILAILMFGGTLVTLIWLIIAMATN